MNTNSRQVRRQIERIVAKAAHSVDKVRTRGAALQRLSERPGRKGRNLMRRWANELMGTTYPPHYDALLNPTSIERAIMNQGVTA